MSNGKIKPRVTSLACPSRKNGYELEAWEQGLLVCGVDEVGRGCLAGPVVTAAVVLKMNKKSPKIKDSKLLSPAQLLNAAHWIADNSWIGYGVISPAAIDRYNIYQATCIAMKRAIIQVTVTCPAISAICVDAMPLTLNNIQVPIYAAPRGEYWSISIAAASIMAKVRRDELLRQLHPLFPGYALNQHKGYATATHRAAINSIGRSIIHRTSFLHEKDEYNESLF